MGFVTVGACGSEVKRCKPHLALLVGGGAGAVGVVPQAQAPVAVHRHQCVPRRVQHLQGLDSRTWRHSASAARKQLVYMLDVGMQCLLSHHTCSTGSRGDVVADSRAGRATTWRREYTMASQLDIVSCMLRASQRGPLISLISLSEAAGVSLCGKAAEGLLHTPSLATLTNTCMGVKV